ncbi:MAG: hypothetical protein R2838_20135 [Caldilineaceae bacterium]
MPGTAAATLLHTIAADLRLRLVGDMAVFDRSSRRWPVRPPVWSWTTSRRWARRPRRWPSCWRRCGSDRHRPHVAPSASKTETSSSYGWTARPTDDGPGEAAAFFVQQVRQGAWTSRRPTWTAEAGGVDLPTLGRPSSGHRSSRGHSWISSGWRNCGSDRPGRDAA